jgi:hypothetical protein
VVRFWCGRAGDESPQICFGSVKVVDAMSKNLRFCFFPFSSCVATPNLPQNNSCVWLQFYIALFFFFKQMTVALTVDPAAILTSPIISGTPDPNVKIVAWCVKTRLADPAAPGVFVAEEDTQIAVAVNLQTGILEVVEDEEESYQAIAYECDASNAPTNYTSTRTYGQGESVRICVKPNDLAQQRGVVIRSVRTFQWTRGEVAQQVVRDPEVVVDHDATTFSCTNGAAVCSIQSRLDTDFYYSAGTVVGSGEVQLQYEFGGGNGGGITRTRLLRRTISTILDTSGTRRKTREAGGVIGTRTFEASVIIDPSKETFQAEAFECNDRDEQILSPQTKTLGDTVRVCVQPDEEARSRGVYVRQIASFQFSQATSGQAQFAVEAGGIQAEDGMTLLSCIPGAPVCSFQTELKESFFDTDEMLLARGQVHLQFGKDAVIPENRLLVASVTMPMAASDTANTVHRQTQTSDAAFAGTADISLSDLVIRQRPSDDVEDPDTEEEWKDDTDSWWHSTPTILRFIYILVPLFFLWLLLCCAAIFFCGWGSCFPSRRDGPKEIRTEEVVEIHYVKKGVDIVEEGEPRGQERYNEHEEASVPKSNRALGKLDSAVPPPPPPEEAAPTSQRGILALSRRDSSQPPVSERRLVTVDESPQTPRSTRGLVGGTGSKPTSSRSPKPGGNKSPRPSSSRVNKLDNIGSPRPKDRRASNGDGNKSPRPSRVNDGAPLTPKTNRRVPAPDTVPHSAPARTRQSVSTTARPKSPRPSGNTPKGSSKRRASATGLPKNGIPNVPF